MEMKRMLRIRKKTKKRKPCFLRQEGHKHAKLKKGWRQPKGRTSKLRMKEKGRGSQPSMGYGSPAAVKGLTRQGLAPIVVSNRDQLELVDKQKEIAVISSGVGSKKREDMLKLASEKGIRVLNAGRSKPRKEKKEPGDKKASGKNESTPRKKDDTYGKK